MATARTTSRDNVVRGPGAVFYGPYVSAKAPGTLVDAGYIAGPVTFQPKVEYHKMDVQEHLAAIKGWPTARTFEVKIPLAEAKPDSRAASSTSCVCATLWIRLTAFCTTGLKSWMPTEMR